MKTVPGQHDIEGLVAHAVSVTLTLSPSISVSWLFLFSFVLSFCLSVSSSLLHSGVLWVS